MDYPNVTVIIANHNYGKYIDKAIDSVFNQQYPQDKIYTVIVDDGSTDNSIDIVKNKIFGKKNVRFIAIAQCVGPSEARNLAIKNTISNTDIYAILDADDEFKQNKLVKCVKPIINNPKVIGGVYADYDILDVKTERITREWKEPYSKERLFQECIIHSGAVLSKQVLLDSRERDYFYDPMMRTCEDWDLWLRISERYLFWHIPESLTIVRNHEENSTNSVSKEVWQQNWNRIKQKLENKYGSRA